jgi:integrase
VSLYDRWHTAKPRIGTDGDPVPKCREHKQYPSTDHGKGDRWQVRWRDHNGKQCKRNFPKKAGIDPEISAEAFDAKVKNDLDRGRYMSPEAGKVTLKFYGDQWLAAQTFDASTRESVELRLRLHVYPHLGEYQLRGLRPSVIQGWVRSLHGTLADSYVRTLFANLSGLLTAAVDDGLIAKNPCRAASVKPPTVNRRRVIPWSTDLVADIRDALPDRYTELVDCGAGLGMRQGEVFGLSVDDLDFLRAVVHVRRQVKIVGARLVFAPPKGGKERDIPLPESVALRLAARIEQYTPTTVMLPWRTPAGKPQAARLLFVSRERKPLNRNYFNTFVWKPALKACKVEPTRANGFHALRHHFASVLLTGGVDIRALAEYLGHNDPGFTLRTYTHVMPSSTDTMRKAVDRALNGQTVDGLTQTSSALDVP